MNRVSGPININIGINQPDPEVSFSPSSDGPGRRTYFRFNFP